MEARAEQLLCQAPLLREAGTEALRDLARLAAFQTLRRGEHLFREGDALETLYLVSRGSVRVYRLARGGTRELTLAVEGAGQLVAGVAALARRVAPVSAAALQAPTEVLGLPAGALRERVFASPALARAAIHDLARRQDELLTRVEGLVFHELGERLAAYLLDHAAAPHPLPTNSELAALLGTVPELVSRKLGEFYRLGLIRLERRTVTVVDVAELARLAVRER